MNQVAIYQYHESREYSFAKEMIGEDYAGSIHCDGFEGYHKFVKAKILGCMAHCRRYFVKAMEISPLHKAGKKLKGKKLQEYCDEHPAYGNIVRIVSCIRTLFGYEKTYHEKGYTASEIREHHQAEQKSLLSDLFDFIETLQGDYTKKSKMEKTIGYALNQREYLMNYLNDGEAEISNNRGERFIKPFVMVRKAWLFSKAKSGAEMSSTYYSLIESTKMNHLDIHGYLEYILTEIQNDPEGVNYKALLPYSPELPDSIRVK